MDFVKIKSKQLRSSLAERIKHSTKRWLSAGAGMSAPAAAAGALPWGSLTVTGINSGNQGLGRRTIMTKVRKKYKSNTILECR